MVGDPQISRIAQVNAQELQRAVEDEALLPAETLDLAAEVDTSGTLRIMGQFKELDKLKEPVKTSSKQETEEQKVLDIAEIDEIAARYQRNNQEELKDKTLLSLRSTITDQDEPEEITAKVFRTYPDHSLADEAFEFLLETTEGKVKSSIRLAKDRFNQEFKREIAAGKNIAEAARTFSKEGLGSPTALRDMYRDIIINQREALQLFEELTEKFRYDKLKMVITFILHSLGADLKSKGPSIMPGELTRLLDETRSLQGILGVFRFFQSRMRLIQRQFSLYNLIFPPRINFEVLGRVFAKILAEKYINPEKIIQVLEALGLSEEVAAQLIIGTQFRDALRQIAPRYYRTPQHRDELLKAILSALDQLEDEMEEEENA